MSIAWGSLLLLVVLLPGVLFYVGLYLPEQFTRETTERSALGQLAATLVVAVAVHGGFFAFAPVVCGSAIPCLNLELFFQAVSLDKATTGSDALAVNIHQFRWWILGYILTTSAVGVGIGYVTGRLAVKGPLRGLTQHSWVYDLSVSDDLTIAYVMTHVQYEERVLMYQGFLKGFGLQRDGRFSYLLLKDAVRGYMHLAEAAPQTNVKSGWHPIGSSGVFVPGLSELSKQHSIRERSYFMIEGEDIANVVFDRLAFDYKAAAKDLDARIKRVRDEFRKSRAKMLDTTHPLDPDTTTPAT